MTLGLFIVLLAWSQSGFAANDSAIPEISANDSEGWLVTFGPGEIYWERFGHNAIWLREPAAGIDHTFNFGFFDFDQEDFFLRFMRGRMLYFSVAQPAAKEFDHYQQENRSIRAQKLNLTSVQYRQLRDYLLNEIQPENRNYRYDYYLNNCSTRIRDALDMALDGALSTQTKSLPASLNFRDQTRRLTQMQFWYYLWLEVGLGYPTDRAVTKWDEMFIPMVVADEIAAMSGSIARNGESLVPVDVTVYTSTTAIPESVPSVTWYRYLLLGLLLSGLVWLSGRFMPGVWIQGSCQAWLLINATVGLVLAALWLLTDHEVTRLNANLLLLNPLFVIGLIPVFRPMVAVLLASGIAIAYLLLLLPEHQYNLDVLAFLTPINLGVSVYLFKRRPSTAVPPSSK